MKNLMMKIKSIVTNRTVLQVCTFALVVGSVAIGRCLPGYAHEPKLPNELIEKIISKAKRQNKKFPNAIT